MADRVFSKADRGLTIINDMTDTTAESAKYRKICFGQMTLEQIWLAFSHDFMAYLQGTSSDSSRHAKTIKCQRKLKPKSCKTYQSTLSNVIYQDSEYNLDLADSEKMTYDSIQDYEYDEGLGLHGSIPDVAVLLLQW